MDKKQRILWVELPPSQYEGGSTDSKGLDTQDCRAYFYHELRTQQKKHDY